jgi:hypothetical protein
LLSPDPRTAFTGEATVDLADARVAVLGCGSVGSLAAWCLASAGVGRLDLADREVLEPANLRRHACSRADLGRPKAEAVAGFLRERFAGAGVSAHTFCFLAEPGVLREQVERSELVVAAVDEEAPKHLLDGMAREMGRSVVYAGLYGGGWGAELILTDPGADTPCYGCTARVLGRVGVPQGPAAPVPGYALPAAGKPESDWVRADLGSILPCAALAARLSVAWLCRRRGQDKSWGEFGRARCSAWQLAIRRVPLWEYGPWHLRDVPVVRQPGCPVCAVTPPPAEALDRLLKEGRP